MVKSKKTQQSTATATTKARVTKKDQLISLLRTKAGADVVTLSEKLGWQ